MVAARTPISDEELARHRTREDIWIALHGNVYDVTDFIEEVSSLGLSPTAATHPHMTIASWGPRGAVGTGRYRSVAGRSLDGVFLMVCLAQAWMLVWHLTISVIQTTLETC